MSIERVTTIDDPRLAVFRDLPSSNLTRPSGLFIAEGWLVVERLLASRFPIDSVLLDERFVDDVLPKLPDAATVYVVPHDWVSEIVGFRFHRGVLACGRRLANRELESLVPLDRRRLLIVVASDVNDPENMGTILRNSAAFGADLVLANFRCADPFSRRVLRTSMGTVFQVPLYQTEDLASVVRRLQDEWQVELAATVLDDEAEPLRTAERPDRFGLVFGNEGHGLPDSLAALCRRRVTIPMHGVTDSLNVGVASGIFLYHFADAAQRPPVSP